MTLRARLALGLFVIAVLLLVPLVLSGRALEHLGTQTRGLRDREFAATTFLGRMRATTDDFMTAENALGVDTAEQALVRAELELARLRAMADSMPQRGLVDSTAPTPNPVAELLAPVPAWLRAEHAAVVAGRGAVADSISADSVRPTMVRVGQQLRAAERSLATRTAQAVDDATQAVADARERTAIAFVLAALLATVVAATLTATISRPVRDLEEGMAKVADGEFDHRLRIAPRRRDEFGRLAHSYGQMTRQLAALDRLKAEFISVASHELKTPINVILGYVQLLEEGIYGQLTPKQRDVIGIIEAQGHSLSRLVRQLLDISRFEAGGGRLDLRPFVLAEFLEQLEQAFAVLARQREVQFAVTATVDVPVTVTWDADRMNEVLGNLLSNAFKFTGRGGRVELRVDAEGEQVHLEVRDTGAGISAEQLPRVFDKFYQADNQAAASAKGTGLGLAISKSIVEAHGGTIGCESTPGVGTSFSMVLPARVPTRRGGTPVVQPLQAGAR